MGLESPSREVFCFENGNWPAFFQVRWEGEIYDEAVVPNGQCRSEKYIVELLGDVWRSSVLL